MPLKLAPTSIEGVGTVETGRRADERGSFARLFCDQEVASALGTRRIVQINHSRTSRVGAVRGMHYQRPPRAELKMVRCLRGRVWDVAVDLREGSATFLKWHAEELSEKNERMLVIPEGCAHGFQVLEPDSELLYLHTAHYAPEYEAGVSHADPRLGIRWPLAVIDLSARDGSFELLRPEFTGIALS